MGGGISPISTSVVEEKCDRRVIWLSGAVCGCNIPSVFPSMPLSPGGIPSGQVFNRSADRTSQPFTLKVNFSGRLLRLGFEPQTQDYPQGVIVVVLEIQAMGSSLEQYLSSVTI